VKPVPVGGCLHLKSACTSLGGGAILANPGWVDTGIFEGCAIVEVSPEEPHAANVLAIGGTVLVPAAHPGTARILEARGFQVRLLDISELMKAEAGLTCSSILFETAGD
jgi:dimethylargininase